MSGTGRGKTIGALLAGLLLAVPCAATSAGQATPRRPSELLGRASEAVGTAEARRAAASLAVDQGGMSYPLEQAWRPSDAFGEASRLYRWRFDAARGRLVREAEQRFPGGIRFWTRVALTPGGGWNVDLLRWRTGVDLIPVTVEDALETRLQWERFLPHLLLAQAAAGDVEPIGDDGFRYADASGAVVDVTLDPGTMLPARAVQVGNGGIRQEVAYLDYQRRHDVMMPTRVQLILNGRLQEEVRLGATRLSRVSDEEVRPPSGYAPPPAASEPRAREIAPGVFFFENMPGDYHSMAVDQGDHLVLVEAPLSPAYAAIQRKLLDQARPGKPVRHVLVTHHHGDHTGGLSAWAASGATIVVPAGARVAIERQLKARNFTGKATIEEVGDRRGFGDGATRVDAHAIASGHDAANLLVHLPAAKLLFQGDLFYAPERGPVPRPFPVTADLKRAIRDRGLAVTRIAGVHGRIGTADELLLRGKSRF